jgi:hypothetical protein
VQQAPENTINLPVSIQDLLIVKILAAMVGIATGASRSCFGLHENAGSRWGIGNVFEGYP